MHLCWWSQKKNAPETGTRILQTGHSKPFAVGEDTQNICQYFGWLRKRFLKCWVHKNWELNVLLSQYKQLKLVWERTILIISIAKYP